MPAFRARRRRSSLAIGLSPVKPGSYGITTSPRNVTFAPNVTPGTYIEETEGNDEATSEPVSPTDALFPPTEAPAPATSRRRAPPGKRRSQGYIPRPPNAFMLFRANFVRQKHVPGSIETNHGSLSKIIGNCWKALPEAEKKVWEVKAKKAKAEHKEMYPNYRFRPVHNKNKPKRKDKLPAEPEDERRCEEVAQLLLEGKKGDELAAAVRRLDLNRAREGTGSASPMPPIQAPLPMMPGMPLYHHRRSSSVPPMMYHPIAVPAMPFFFGDGPTMSRPESPVSSIARANRMMYGQRRASSAGPSYYDHWAIQGSLTPGDLQQDPEPLPDLDPTLFNPSFLNGASPFGMQMSAPGHNYNCDPSSNPALALSISPLDGTSMDSLSDNLSSASTAMYSAVTPDSLNPWMQQSQYEGHTPSGSPSAYSTPPPPEAQTPPHLDMNMNMYGQQAERGYDDWSHHVAVAGHDSMAPSMDDGSASYNQYVLDDTALHLQDYACGLEQAQQMYAESTPGCGVESNPYSLSDGLNLGMEVSQY